LLLDFKIIMLGVVATPPTCTPCPTVPLPDDGAVNVTTENPAVVFALTDDVIVPAVLLTAVPPAFQFQATKVEPLPLYERLLPRENPFELKDTIVFDCVPSAPVVFVSRYVVEPRITSFT
jgi:hypothetical protein